MSSCAMIQQILGWAREERTVSVKLHRASNGLVRASLEVPPTALNYLWEDVVLRDLEPGDIDQQEVRPVRNGVAEPKPIEDVHEDLSSLSVLPPLDLEELPLRGLLEPDGGRLLEGTVRAKDDAGRSGEDGRDERGGADKPSYPPAGGGEGL